MAAGGKPWQAADKGKPLQTCCRYTPRQPKKTERSDNRCADRRESPLKGRAPRRAGRSRRRRPTRPTARACAPGLSRGAAKRAEKPTRPNDESIMPIKDDQRDEAASRRYESDGRRKGFTDGATIEEGHRRHRPERQQSATQPTERLTNQSRAQGGGCVVPTRAPCPHLTRRPRRRVSFQRDDRDDRAAWATGAGAKPRARRRAAPQWGRTPHPGATGCRVCALIGGQSRQKRS